MTINIRTLIKTGCAAAVLAIGFLAAHPADAASVRREPNGAIHFYDDNGYDAGYKWCGLGSGGSSFGAPVCDYYTLQQCEASGSPQTQCTPNPWSYYVNVPRQGRLQLQ